MLGIVCRKYSPIQCANIMWKACSYNNITGKATTIYQYIIIMLQAKSPFVEWFSGSRSTKDNVALLCLKVQVVTKVI